MVRSGFAKAVLVGLVAAGLFVSTPAQAASIVINGGFETGDCTGWTLGGNTGFSGVINTAPYVNSGSFGAFFGAVGSDTSLSQNLATTPGGRYDLTYFLYSPGGTPNDFSVVWNGVTETALVNAGAFGYTQFTFQGLLATGSSTTLQFLLRQDPSFWGLDDIAVTPSVPEPSSILLLGSGLLLAGRLIRRKVA